MTNSYFPFDFEEDIHAKSLSFYLKDKSVKINQSVIDKLLMESANRGHCNARLCLHQSPQDSFHEMVILEYQNRYYRPHRHPEKSESIHIIRGSLGVFNFSDKGQINGCEKLMMEHSFLFRIGSNIWHTVVPLTDYIIYLESKPGPFNRDHDREYPDWAPGDVDEQKGLKYIESLLAKV